MFPPSFRMLHSLSAGLEGKHDSLFRIGASGLRAGRSAVGRQKDADAQAENCACRSHHSRCAEGRDFGRPSRSASGRLRQVDTPATMIEARPRIAHDPSAALRNRPWIKALPPAPGGRAKVSRITPMTFSHAATAASTARPSRHRLHCQESWCPRSDSNRHALRRRILNPLRLPFRHSGQLSGV